MQRFSSILVAIDTRLEEHPVAALAADVAKHNGSSVTLVDVVPSVSWLARLGRQDDSAHLREATRENFRTKLEATAQPLRDAGISVKTRVLDGDAWVGILEEVERGQHDVVLAVSQGKNSTHGGYFGQTAKRLLRHCPVPVWLVPPSSLIHLRHIVACVDTYSEGSADAELNERIYQLASSISAFRGARLSVLHAWQMEDEALLASRLKPAVVAEFAEKHRAYRQKLLDQFLRPYGQSVESADVHFINKPPAEAVAEFCASGDVDLVVMGTMARSGLAGFVIGNTAEAVLDQLATGVLAIKPSSFKASGT